MWKLYFTTKLHSPNEFLIEITTWKIWAKFFCSPSLASRPDKERWTVTSAQILSLERKKPFSDRKSWVKASLKQIFHDGQKD